MSRTSEWNPNVHTNTSFTDTGRFVLKLQLAIIENLRLKISMPVLNYCEVYVIALWTQKYTIYLTDFIALHSVTLFLKGCGLAHS